MPETDLKAVGQKLYGWARDLFPICRSLTGPGVRESLSYLRRLLPGLTIHEVPSGTQAFDWIVPEEWEIREAFIEDEKGRRIVDFRENNLHVVGYSEPLDAWLVLEELQPHLHSLPDLPDAVPYVTSYYKRTWGFSLSQRLRDTLKSGRYRVKIESSLRPGHLTYGELMIPGEIEKEVFFSTYICHPSMANDQVSGLVVVAGIADWLLRLKRRRLTYRIALVPETIGSLVYLSRHLEAMKERVIAGLVVACVGDEREYSILTSRNGDTLADRVLRHVLRHHAGDFKEYDFLWPNRGSDERNYCMPGIDLPIASFFRSKYGSYPEYHTSLDNLQCISPDGLASSFEAVTKFVTLLENNFFWRTTCLGEPQLGNRGLYPSHLTHRSGYEKWLAAIMNSLAYSDGTRDLVALAERIHENALELIPVINRLAEEGLLASSETPFALGHETLGEAVCPDEPGS